MLIEELMSFLPKKYDRIAFVYFSSKQERLDVNQLSLHKKVSEHFLDEELVADDVDKDKDKVVYVISLPLDGSLDLKKVEKLAFLGEGAVYTLIHKALNELALSVVRKIIDSGKYVSDVSMFSSLNQYACITFVDSSKNAHPIIQKDLMEKGSKKRGRGKDSNSILSEQLAELKKENKRLRSLWDNAKEETAYYKKRNQITMSSFSFRFGNLFVEASKSPKKFFLFPCSITKFLFNRAYKKILAEQGKANAFGEQLHRKNTHKIVDEKNGELRSLIKKISDKDADKLGEYLVDFNPTDDWMAVVGSDGENLPVDLQVSKDIKQIYPNTWFLLFKKELPNRIIIDHDVMAQGGKWGSCLEGGAYGYPYHLVELLSFCSSHSIRVVLWKEYGGQNVMSSDLLYFVSEVYSGKDKKS